MTLPKGSETVEVIVNPDGSLTPTDGDREPDRIYAVLIRQDDGSYREGLADPYRHMNRRRRKRLVSAKWPTRVRPFRGLTAASN